CNPFDNALKSGSSSERKAIVIGFENSVADCSRWGRLFGPSLESQEPNRRTIEQKGTCDTPFYGAEAPWALSPTEVTDLSSACSPSFPLFELRVETCSTFSITPSCAFLQGRPQPLLDSS